VYALYIYCLTKKSGLNGFSTKGLDGQSIFNIDYKDIMALVHSYIDDLDFSSENTISKELIDAAMKHHQVVEEAWKNFGTLIPLRFGSIIQGEDNESAIQNVKAWIERIYDHIESRFEDLKDKAEYGLQIFWSNDLLMKRVFRNHTQIKHMEKKIADIPKESAFFYKDRHKSLLQRYITKEIVLASRSLLDRVRPYLNNFQIGQIKAEVGDKRMLLNLSCLLSEKEILEIRQELEAIKTEEGYIPCLSGPWPPYSFAKLDEKLSPRNGPTCHVQPGGRVRCA